LDCTVASLGNTADWRADYFRGGDGTARTRTCWCHRSSRQPSWAPRRDALGGTFNTLPIRAWRAGCWSPSRRSDSWGPERPRRPGPRRNHGW